MGTEDYIVKIHETLGEVAADILWLKQNRLEDLERISEYKKRKYSFRTCVAIIGIPLIISAGVFMVHMTKNVDILCAIHKPQMAIFGSGQTIVDPHNYMIYSEKRKPNER